MKLARWCIMLYSMPRSLVWEGSCTAPFRVWASIVAGCAHATTMLKAFLLDALDGLSAKHLQVRLKVTVDDVGLRMHGSNEMIIRQFPKAAKDLVEVMQDDLKAKINFTRTVALGSNRTVRQGLKRSLGTDNRRSGLGSHKQATQRTAEEKDVAGARCCTEH